MREDPDVIAGDLRREALELDEGVDALSLQQFHSRYLLPAKKRLQGRDEPDPEDEEDEGPSDEELEGLGQETLLERSGRLRGHDQEVEGPEPSGEPPEDATVLPEQIARVRQQSGLDIHPIATDGLAGPTLAEAEPREPPGEAGFARVGTREEVTADRHYTVQTEEEPSPLQRAREKTEGFFRRHFTVAGDLSKTAFEKEVRRSARIQAELKRAEFVNRDLDRALKEAGFRGGLRDMSEEQKQVVDRALKGDLEAVPEPVRGEVRRARDHIDRLSRRMIDEGVIEGDLEATVRENLGTYATRSYRIFDDPKWAERVPQKVRNRAKAWFREEIKRREPEIAQSDLLGDDPEAELEARAEGAINEILYDKYDSPLHFFTSRKGSKDLGTLKRRKDVPEPIRELMGEYKDPRVNYARSVANMAQLLENQRFLNEVREAGFEEGWLHENPTGEFAAKLAADESDVMSPLNGLYTRPEIKRAWENVSIEEVSGVTRWLLAKPIAYTKMGKTVLSPMTHVRNFESNVLPQVANGHNPFRHWGEARDVVSAELPVWESLSEKLGADIEARREYMLKLKELGVVDQSARAGEMRDILRDAFDASSDRPTDATRGQLRGAAEGVVDLYQSEDDFWKAVFFESERARYEEALPEATEEELDQRAAELTRALMPTYERVPDAVKRLRRFPFLSSFPSFYAEVIRNSYNLVAQTRKELASDNPKVRAIGRKRAAGILTAGAVAPAVSAGSRFLVGYGLYEAGRAAMKGMDEEDEDEGRLAHAISATEDADIRRFLPPWSKNSTIVYLGRNEEGNLEWVDLSYTDYYAGLRKPVTAALRGEGWQESFWGSVKELSSPFASEDIFVQKIVDLARNKKATGGEVWNPGDATTQKIEDALSHLWEAIEPGVLRSGRRIEQGLKGKVTPYGQSYSAPREALAAATGVRFQELDFRQAFGFRAFDHRRSIRGAQRVLTSVASNRGTVSREEITETYERAERQRRKAWAQAYKDARAAMRTGGMSPEETFRALDQAGFSDRDARLILRGQYVPYVPSQGFIRDVATTFQEREASPEEIENLRERIDAIRSFVTSQPEHMVYSDGEWVPAGRERSLQETTNTNRQPLYR